MLGETIKGFYGNDKPANIFICHFNTHGQYLRAYCVEGKNNINVTFEDIPEGCNIELLSDLENWTSRTPIYDIYELIKQTHSRYENVYPDL